MFVTIALKNLKSGEIKNVSYLNPKSLFEIDGYLAVIQKIQNVYYPEKVTAGYEWGFKYESGIFEFYTLKTLKQALKEYERLGKALEDYWSQKKS